MDIDKALHTVGGYRRYHLTMFVLLGFSLFMPVCWQGLIIVFTGWEPHHHCRVNADVPINQTIPFEIGPDGKSTLSKCRMYNDTGDRNETVKCQNGWTYDNEGIYTIVEQWDLVCDYNYLIETSQTIFQLGYLSSTLAFSFLSDKFGRKYVHIVTHLLIGFLGVVVAFSTSYIMFLAVKIALGMLITANVNSGLTYLMELFDSKRRAFIGVGMEFQWISCYLALPLMAYFITDWRVFQIVISCSSFIWIIYFWIMPESPLWLAAVGRWDEAEEVLQEMARRNRVKLNPEEKLLKDAITDPAIIKPPDSPHNRPNIVPPQTSINTLKCSKSLMEAATVTAVKQTVNGAIIDNDYDEINSDESEADFQTTDGGKELPESLLGTKMSITQTGQQNDEKVPLKALLTDHHLRLVLIISNLLWFANCLVYYGLILSTPKLAGNRYINFLIMGFVEIPATLCALYSIDRLGRRWSTSLYHIIAGIPLAVLVIIPNETTAGVDLSPVIITLTMLSKFGISASFAVIILYTKELFPTSVRGTGGGICQILGNVGNIIAPLAMYAAKTSLYWLPNVLFGAVSIAVGLLVLVLPETAKRPLPQTLDDLHDMFRTITRCGPAKTTTSSRHIVQTTRNILRKDLQATNGLNSTGKT